jgi:hypothetical protein
VAPVSISGDGRGTLFALDDRCLANSYLMTSGAIVVFGASADGASPPSRIISGPKTGLNCP